MNANAARAQILEILRGPVTRGIVRTIDPENAVTTATFATTGTIYWMRWKEGGKISTVRFAVSTASGNICIACAKNVGTGYNAVPGERVATTGSFACPSSGSTNISVPATGANGDHEQPLAGGSITVQAGDWVGIAADNTSAVLRGTTGSGNLATVLTAGCSYKETIASGSPAIPVKREALTPFIGRDWLIIGV